MRKILLLLFCVFPAFGQSASDKSAEDYAKARLRGPVSPSDVTALTDPAMVTSEVVARSMAAKLGAKQIQAAFTRRRTDAQFGANAGGGTSLVSKAGLPEFLSAAAESGAFQRATDGTVTTVRVSAIGLKRLSSTQDCSIGTLCYDRFAAKGLELHVSFDRGSGGTVVPLTTTGSPSASALGALRPTGRISSAGLKWDLLARTQGDGLAKELETAAGKLTDPGKALATAISDTTNSAAAQALNLRFRNLLFPLLDAEFADAPKGFAAMPAASQASMDAEYTARTKRAIAAAVEKAMVGVDTEGIEASYKTWMEAQDAFTAEREKVLNGVLYKSHGALEFNYLNPASTPNMFTTRFSFTNALGAAEAGKSDKSGPLTTVSVNFAASVYEKIPANLKVGRFRDVQAAAQLDRKLGKAGWELRPTFSLAGYYQYQAQNAVIEFKQDTLVPNTNIPLPRPAIEVLDTKGSIVIGQAKLVIPLSSSVSIPVSFSGSNRTELLKNNINFNAQAGITFDLSGILHH